MSDGDRSARVEEVWFTVTKKSREVRTEDDACGLINCARELLLWIESLKKKCKRP